MCQRFLTWPMFFDSPQIMQTMERRRTKRALRHACQLVLEIEKRRGENCSGPLRVSAPVGRVRRRRCAKSAPKVAGAADVGRSLQPTAPKRALCRAAASDQSDGDSHFAIRAHNRHNTNLYLLSIRSRLQRSFVSQQPLTPQQQKAPR